MAENLSWNYVVQALHGPALSGQAELAVDAYDKIAVTIGDGTSQEVTLVPGGTISLLVINPAVPDPQLSYEVGGNAILLDGPHILIGTGAVSLLGGAASLTFSNATGADATIEILLGRDATP